MKYLVFGIIPGVLRARTCGGSETNVIEVGRVLNQGFQRNPSHCVLFRLQLEKAAYRRVLFPRVGESETFTFQPLDPATAAKGTKLFRNFSIGNDLFTTMFTVRMGRIRMIWPVKNGLGSQICRFGLSPGFGPRFKVGKTVSRERGLSEIVSFQKKKISRDAQSTPTRLDTREPNLRDSRGAAAACWRTEQAGWGAWRRRPSTRSLLASSRSWL